LGTYKSQDIGGAVEASLRAGYRHIDCASHYGNEPLIGEAFTKVLNEGVIKREQLFITSKLWYGIFLVYWVRQLFANCVND
jgi:alcohol dehydrogenase (NADP+)